MQRYNSDMLKLARQSRGLSQSELSELMGVVQGTISKIELRIATFSSEIAAKASECLDYPLSFFTQNDYIYPSSLIYYRRKSKVPGKSIEHIEAKMNVLRIALEKLLNNVELADSNLIEWDGVDSPSIAAMRLREQWRLPKGRINRLVSLLEDHGIIVIPFNFGGEDFDGLSFQTTKGNWVILINSVFPTDKQRLTLAHEVGHIVMHIGKNYSITNAEREAFEFGSEFLVPYKEWVSQFTKLDLGVLGDMKRYWKVSMRSLVYKAEITNLLTKNQAKYLWQLLAPFKKREPVELEAGTEKPTLLNEIIEIHKNELNFSTEELLASLSLNIKDFEGLLMTSVMPVRMRVLKL